MSYDGRDGWKICLFPARVGISNFDVILLDSTFPYLYLDLACKQLCFPPGKGINRRNESTRHNFIYHKVLMIISSIVFPFVENKTVKISKLISSINRNNQLLLTDQYFSRKR